MTAECAKCGSQSLAWRVKRVVGQRAALSERALVWTCRGCGSEWTEAIQLSVEEDRE